MQSRMTRYEKRVSSLSSTPSKLRQAFRRLLQTCALLLALVPSLAHAQEAIVDIPTARRLAMALLESNQPRAAEALFKTLLDQNPEDAGLLIGLSRTQRALGQFEEAAATGRKAFSAATPGLQRFHAARVTAQALASGGHQGRAQFWLRRAAQHAPDARAMYVLRQEYGYVRSRNPLSFRISGSITPSDNINDAPTTNQIVIGGHVYTDPTAHPIAGLEYQLNSTLAWRLPATETRQSEVSLSYSGRRVTLGSEVASIDPTLTAKVFASDRVTLGWSGRYLMPNRRDVLGASANVFVDWNAAIHSQTGTNFSLNYTWQISERSQLRFGGQYEHLTRFDQSIRTSDTWRAMLDWSTQVPEAGRVQIGVTVSDTDSESPAIAHQAYSTRISYYFAEPILTAQVGISTEYRHVLFDRPLYSAQPREDRSLTTSLSASFPNWQVYGFAPVLELRQERNRSNVTRYDTQSTGLSVSFRSTF